METTEVRNKRVAKNAIALTLRMVLITIVGLFTSRVVLQVLGVSDYGIYGVIGGVVGFAAFLNTTMAGATSRFITFELGRENEAKLNKIFSTALIIHLILALTTAILAETVGLWFVNNKMDFPPGRMVAVNILYQFTILSLIVGYTQVPYTAAIIAHERMNIYAYIEIINVLLKLGIVYLLYIVHSDRLIFYAALMLGVSILSAFIYRFYCIRNFKETKFRWQWDKAVMKDMLKFSGFDFYGNMCWMVRNSSLPLILNVFFGVLANAGASIATTVTGAVGGLTNSVAQAYEPQIVKMYATNKFQEMTSVMRHSVQFTLLAYALLGIPVFVGAHNILFLWLGQVPEYSVEFLRLIILTAFFNIVLNTNNCAIRATGDVKYISFISGSVYLLCPILSYLVLKYIYKEASVVYFLNVVTTLIISMLGWIYIKIQIPKIKLFDYVFPICKSWLAIGFAFILTIISVRFFNFYINLDTQYLNILLTLIIDSIIGIIILLGLYMLIAINKNERYILVSYIRKRIFRKKALSF